MADKKSDKIDLEAYRHKIDDLCEKKAYAEVIKTITAVPISQRTDDMHRDLSMAYNNLGQYDKAMQVLTKHPEMDNFYWHYSIAYCMYMMAAKQSSQANPNSGDVLPMLKYAREEFSTALALIDDADGEDKQIAQDCRDFIQSIEDSFGTDVFDAVQLEVPENNYSEKDSQIVSSYIIKTFGEIAGFLEEDSLKRKKISVCVITPKKGGQDKEKYTLVTIGLGAYLAKVPAGAAKEPKNLERAELMLRLPPRWRINSDEDRYRWPLELLSNLIDFACAKDSGFWCDKYHLIENKYPYADATKLCGMMLSNPEIKGRMAPRHCKLSNGSRVNFFQIVPLYAEEMEYMKEHHPKLLLDMLKEYGLTIDNRRPNVTEPDIDEEEYDDEFIEYLESVIDDGNMHAEFIKDAELALDSLAGFNHIAIFLEWSIEHNLMSDEFRQECSRIVNEVKNGGGKVDLREAVRDDENMNGCLMTWMFSDAGVDFCNYYYANRFSADDDTMSCYFNDIDAYAMQHFGTKKYNSHRFKGAAYLFVPYDEKYRQNMARIIGRRYREWMSTTQELKMKTDESENPGGSPILLN